MIRVAVTQRVSFQSERGERWDAVDQRLERWLLRNSMLPMPVPNGFGMSELDTKVHIEEWFSVRGPRALLLSGGNDLGEAPDRDRVERALLEIASESRIPALGICRGMQMMAVWGGTKLVAVSGHVGQRHDVDGVITREVNSFHRFGIADCPDGFEVLACGDDGCIEAIAHSELPWEAWMWHPEREDPFADEDSHRLTALFRA